MEKATSKNSWAKKFFQLKNLFFYLSSSSCLFQKKLFVIYFAFFFSGCGYYISSNDSLSQTSISIPFIQGDIDGSLTEAVAYEISLCSQLRLVNRDADVIMQARLINEEKEWIGFQYDRKAITGKRVNRLVPNEERQAIEIEITLLSGNSGEVIYGPFLIKVFTDYDFVISNSLDDLTFINSQGQRKSVLFFSLGQLDSIEGASLSAKIPLYHRIAKKIADGICHLSFSLSKATSN